MRRIVAPALVVALLFAGIGCAKGVQVARKLEAVFSWQYPNNEDEIILHLLPEHYYRYRHHFESCRPFIKSGHLSDCLDIYSYLYTSEELALLLESIRGERAATGLGAQVIADDRGGFFVLRVLYDSPAYEAGIEEGSRIVGLVENKEKILFKGTSEEAKKFSESGTVLNLLIVKEGETSPLTVSVKLGGYEVPVVDYYPVLTEGGLAYIRINNWIDRDASALGSTQSGLKDAADALLSQGPKMVVFDTRNPGGSLEAVLEVLTLFESDEDAPLVTLRREGRQTLVRSRGAVEHSLPPVFANIPCAVVVDSETASSSEIFAQYLKYKGCHVVSAHRSTRGKGTVQNIFPLPEGGGIQITAYEYFVSRDEYKMHGVGVTPTMRMRVPGEGIRSRATDGEYLRHALRVLVEHGLGQ